MNNIVSVNLANRLYKNGFSCPKECHHAYAITDIHIDKEIDFKKDELINKYYPGISICAPTYKEAVTWINDNNITIRCEIDNALKVYNKNSNDLLLFMKLKDNDQLTNLFKLDNVINALLEYVSK